MTPIIKICGLKDTEALAAAAESGATHAGFNFFARSPRYVDLHTAARLAETAPMSLVRVALLVDPTDAEAEAAVAALQAQAIQLHGRETPARAAALRTLTGLPVIKAVPVAARADIDAAQHFTAADHILFDAKPPAGADLPGGNGVAFDWSLLAGLALPRPWILSGGLDSANVAEAIRATGAPGVDVSSGVETSPGRKSPERIAAFVAAALSAYGSLTAEPVA
ncbi:MAG: phosphoribosylanthranilate isomerase [Alphaproteobacteria bacterium]|nr:phosphoribosylanthranilate isomerase [Alphaproteobacteria bacterium]